MRLAKGSNKILDVMTYLVGDNICVGEITVCAKLGFHTGEETEVYVEYNTIAI